MAQHGIAESVISDNGPCYSSGEFRHFAETRGFTHTTTSPHYPQSNGLAEKTVQTAKRILYTAKAENKDPYLSLLKSQHTCRQPEITGTASNESGANEFDPASNGKTTAATGRLPANCTREERGAPIRFRQEDAMVTQPAAIDRSYHIKTRDGQTYRRHRQHLRESREDASATDAQQMEPSTSNTQVHQQEPAEPPDLDSQPNRQHHTIRSHYQTKTSS
ncbi:hypothetical protein SKAU_G00196320 [Synaphobranchus kaupii]|uniref:Integrase catalytic domain-containing protein n=1 Tax=Synaphobranchus kaupii TaxID=118154 RepID=A0A9Q1FEJ0_SYNKA|nr:hypothetical protein SKAU_G00196320 [Synaphobranchus kaupii]